MTYILTYTCVCTIQFKPIQCNSGQFNPIQFLLVVTCVSLFSFISTVVVYQVINSLLTLSRRVRCKCWGDDFTTCTYRVDTFHIILRLGIQYRTNTGIEPFNTTIEMDIVGAKVRVFGEAIYDSDNLIPQVAIGGFYKKNKKIRTKV